MKISTGRTPKAMQMRLPRRQPLDLSIDNANAPVALSNDYVLDVWIIEFYDEDVIDWSCVVRRQPRTEKRRVNYIVMDPEQDEYVRKQYNIPDDARVETRKSYIHDQTERTIEWWEVTA